MFHGFGDSKICQFEDSLIIDEYVLGFDVPVDDFIVVQVVKSFDQLDKPVHDEFFFQEFIVFAVFANADRKVAILIEDILHSQYSMMMTRTPLSRKNYLKPMMFGCISSLWI